MVSGLAAYGDVSYDNNSKSFVLSMRRADEHRVEQVRRQLTRWDTFGFLVWNQG